MLRKIEAGQRVTAAEYREEVSRGHSRETGRKAAKSNRRPERCPARGLKERRSCLPRKTVIASGESRKRKFAGWDENRIGAARDDAPVTAQGASEPFRPMDTKRIDLICRTAGYVTRTSSGVGGRSREASSYPD
jgi:hypothetical protein